MRIAIQGCCHGELNKIYSKITDKNIDLLLVCGDFQAIRNKSDLNSMAVPVKYRKMGDFQDYWLGKRKAPVLTVFIGGNHEASEFLCERYYGGWVAPNIYFLGLSGCVKFGGLRIGGISGIYNSRHYKCGYFERSPLDRSTQRSIYHTREFEVEKASFLNSEAAGESIDIFLSHEWPRRVYHHGDVEKLLKIKPFFRQDISTEELGCPGCEKLLHTLKPKYWFSAHLHCAFEASIHHKEGSQTTEFLALDKCIPGREHLRIMEIASPKSSLQLEFDTRWLAILALTHATIPRNYEDSESLVDLNEACIKEKELQIENEILHGNLLIPLEQSALQAILDSFLGDPKILTYNNS